MEGRAGKQEVRLDGGALRDLFSAHGKQGVLEEGPGLVVCVCIMCIYRSKHFQKSVSDFNKYINPRTFENLSASLPPSRSRSLSPLTLSPS